MVTNVYEQERTLTRDVTELVERGLPGVEVIAVELTGRERFCVYIDHAQGVDHALCERVTNVLRDYLRDYSVDVSSPGVARPCESRSTSGASSATASRSRRRPRSAVGR